MTEENLHNKIVSATKWSTITEVASKLVSPVTNVILARILTPEIFGVVATVTMIVSFAEMFTDAGFQKYLIQHEFKNENIKFKNANVAFWTNFFISIFIWLFIVLCRDSIAVFVGNPGLGNVVAIASFQLILTSFSSIQMALYRRDFAYKKLFFVRIISMFIPLTITLPLAFYGLGYWAIIIGNLVIQLTNALFLTFNSKWKPSFFYDFGILKEMFSFSMWSLVEAISIWFTTWIDSFIIGGFLNQYYLGLYKTSTTMVNSLMGLITGATTPVLFSSLSRLQQNNEEFDETFMKFQKLISMIVMPLGMGLYLYRDLATKLLLGSQWSEASDVIGMWSLSSSIVIVFGHYSSEYYRAKGKPRLSFFVQICHLIVLVPSLYISLSFGFKTFLITRSIVRLQMVVVHMLVMKYYLNFKISRIFVNLLPIMFASIVMSLTGLFLQKFSSSYLWSFTSILLCILIYLLVLFLIPNTRKELKTFFMRIIHKKSGK